MQIIKILKMNNPFLSPVKRAKDYEPLVGRMGKNVQIFYKVSFGSEPYLIELGDNVKITYGVKFITHDGGIHVLRNIDNDCNQHIYGKIIVKNNVFIGNDSIILPGVTIGENCIIGAGSIVTKSIPDNSVVAGIPAKAIEDTTTYREKMKSHIIQTNNMTFLQKKEYLLNLWNDSPEKFLKK